MYLRESRRTNRDGSVVSYLQLAHNQRNPQTGTSTAKVIHNFGRAEQIDRDALARLVASQALEPGSKLAATRWIGERVAIDGCTGLSDDQAYRAMDFLLDALDEIAAQIFGSVAHLLNLDLDIVFVDTTSTYWEVETADSDPELADPAADDELANPAEQARRALGHSKDHRDDLPQVVIAMAVTRDGIPVRCWTFPGDTADTAIIRTIKDDLGGWGLRRLVWVADRGFASAANRAAHLTQLIDGSDTWPARRRDELVGSLRAKPGLRRYLRRTSTGLLRVDHAAIKREQHLDGKWLLRTSDLTLTPDDLAAAYKQLIAVVETAVGDTWRTVRHELDRMALVILATDHGRVAQRSTLTAGHKSILTALGLPEPARYFDFTTTSD